MKGGRMGWLRRALGLRPAPKEERKVPAAPAAPKKRAIRDTAIAASLSGSPFHFELTPITELPRPTNPFAPATMGKDSVPVMAQDDASAFFSGAFGGSLGFVNIHEGIGFFGYPYLSELAQRSEYRKGAESLAREMTRKWIKLTAQGDDDDGQKAEKLKLIEKAMRDLRVRQAFRRAAELDGFFGRAHVYLDTGDGDDPEELRTPLIADRRKIKKGGLKGIRVVEPYWCYPNTYNATDPLRRDFMSPQTWMVNAKEIHATRLMTLVGREVPDMLKPAYAFGGLSLSQMAKPYVDNWLRTRQSVSDLVHSFTVFGLKTDLMSTLSGADDGDQMIKRAQLFNNLRDSRGLMLMDKGVPAAENAEDLVNISAPLAGLDKLQAQSQEQMSAVFSIPLVILLGITPSGLNASSDGEIWVFYDYVLSYQEHLFRGPLEVVLKVVQMSLFGEIDPDIGFDFVPLWQLDEAGQANVWKTKVDADVEYISAGVLDPLEVRKRLADDKESPYAGIDADDVPEPPAEEGGEGEGGGPGLFGEGGEEKEATGQKAEGKQPRAREEEPARPAKPPKILASPASASVGKGGE